MSLPVAILAGGLATRLHPVTERIPKSLVDVAGKPFAEHQIELLRRHGLRDIVFLVGHLGVMLQDRLGDGARHGVSLRYVYDGPVALGTGGAIARAGAVLGEMFFVLYGDSYLECPYGDIERAFLASGKSGLMTVYRNEDRFDRSNVVYADGVIARYDKGHRTPEMHYIDYGLGVFRSAAFGGRPSGQAFDLATIYQALIARNDLAGFEVSTRFYEIGSPAGLEETRRFLEKKVTSVR